MGWRSNKVTKTAYFSSSATSLHFFFLSFFLFISFCIQHSYSLLASIGFHRPELLLLFEHDAPSDEHLPISLNPNISYFEGMRFFLLFGRGRGRRERERYGRGRGRRKNRVLSDQESNIITVPQIPDVGELMLASYPSEHGRPLLLADSNSSSSSNHSWFDLRESMFEN